MVAVFDWYEWGCVKSACQSVSVGRWDGGVEGWRGRRRIMSLLTHLLHWCVKPIIVQVAEESVVHSPTFIPEARQIGKVQKHCLGYLSNSPNVEFLAHFTAREWTFPSIGCVPTSATGYVQRFQVHVYMYVPFTECLPPHRTCTEIMPLSYLDQPKWQNIPVVGVLQCTGTVVSISIQFLLVLERR